MFMRGFFYGFGHKKTLVLPAFLMHLKGVYSSFKNFVKKYPLSFKFILLMFSRL